MQGWKNTGNSCYMDTIIFSLFFKPNTFIKKKILKDDDDASLNELRMILKNVKKGKNCNELRRWIHTHYNEAFPSFYDTEQHEALEFLEYLFSLFRLNGVDNIGTIMEYNKRYGVYTKTIKNVVWYDWIKVIDKKASNIFIVPFLELKKQNRYLEKYFSLEVLTYPIQDAKYKKCSVNCSQEKNILYRMSDLMIIALQRENPINNRVMHYNVRIPEKIQDQKGKELYLYSVIMHLGESIHSGHYISLYRIKEKWYLYDDLVSVLKEVSMTKYRSMAQKNGVLYFYSKSK